MHPIIFGSGIVLLMIEMPEKDDIDCQEMPELFHDYYGIKINKDYSGIDVKHPNDIEKHYSVSINVYRFNSNKPMMKRHSDKHYKQIWITDIYTNLKLIPITCIVSKTSTN
ncbi:hypothetical protein QVD99_004935 [Batrachochytrium dendrobatidis]|nr:hypothetical protein QVD99_004935 [Batrachochytrium dendrobatidis]